MTSVPLNKKNVITRSSFGGQFFVWAECIDKKCLRCYNLWVKRLTRSEVSYTEKQLIAAAIHDMSGFGRCSLSVIIPVISAMGIQCVPVPTAILSTHTGGFDGFVFKDTTELIQPFMRHYKELGVKFNAVYTGFLASARQVDCCFEFFESFPEALRIVDPVMGDDGKPYKTYTKELIDRMKELVKRADIITPNMTEAALLLGEEYTETLSPEKAEEWTRRLCDMAGAAVMTGARLDSGEFSNLCFDGRNNEFSRVDWKPLPVSYPGTGDIFASVLTGMLLRHKALTEAVKAATEFSRRCVEVTVGSGQPERNGVEFERVLGELCSL